MCARSCAGGLLLGRGRRKQHAGVSGQSHRQFRASGKHTPHFAAATALEGDEQGGVADGRREEDP